MASVPRACGDEPVVIDAPAINILVFPARAGMNRPRCPSPSPSGCVPRACGDEPPSKDVPASGGRVFPARAGMNLTGLGGALPCSSVPRACGDEPATSQRSRRRTPFSARNPRACAYRKHGYIGYLWAPR